MFRHSKNSIQINDLTVTAVFFQEQEPGYSLPEGSIGRHYTPGVEHVLEYPGRFVGVDLPWAEGDEYFSKIEQYREVWEAKKLAEAPTPVEPPKYPQWETLKNSLRSSDLFAKAYEASSAAPGAWSLLLTTLDSNSPPNDAGRLQDFQFAIAQIRLALGSNDFTAAQIERFNQILIECHFELTIS